MSLPAAKQIYIYQRKLGFLLCRMATSALTSWLMYTIKYFIALVLKLCDDTFVAWRAVVASMVLSEIGFLAPNMRYLI